MKEEGSGFSDKTFGRGFKLYFEGLNEKPGQFEILADTDAPLTGSQIFYNASVLEPYSTNIFYEPIPFEMLKTYETAPQVVVTVDDLPAVCHSSCDFTHKAAVGEVTEVTFDEANKKVVITGTELPS